MSTTEEQYLHDQITILQKQYAMALEPYIKRLAAIESMRPPKPILLSRDAAMELGFFPRLRGPGW